MSRFSGKQFRGAGRADRVARKLEAEERNARTRPERRSGTNHSAEYNKRAAQVKP